MSEDRYLKPGDANFCLAHLVEEMGEALAAAGKTQRWGLLSVNPDLAPAEQETNRDWLLRELDDVEGAIKRLRSALGIEPSPAPTGEGDLAALRRYRAVTHWIGADSWDGCSDCIERVKWATQSDANHYMTSDEIAGEMRPFFKEWHPGSDETAPKPNIPTGEGEWLRSGHMLYTLAETGWRKGKPVTENALMVMVTYQPSAATEAEHEALIQRIHAFLGAPKPPASERVTEVDEAMVDRAVEAYIHEYCKEDSVRKDAMRAALAAALGGE